MHNENSNGMDNNEYDVYLGNGHKKLLQVQYMQFWLSVGNW